MKIIVQVTMGSNYSCLGNRKYFSGAVPLEKRQVPYCCWMERRPNHCVEKRAAGLLCVTVWRLEYTAQKRVASQSARRQKTSRKAPL